MAFSDTRLASATVNQVDDDTGAIPFVAFVMNFATSEGSRDLVYQRLGQHVDRRASEEADVEGLFNGKNSRRSPPGGSGSSYFPDQCSLASYTETVDALNPILYTTIQFIRWRFTTPTRPRTAVL